MLKVGTLLLLSRTTRRPLGNVASSARGSLTFRTFLLTGALPLISAPFAVCPAGPDCTDGCAKASDEPSATSASATKSLLILFVILIAYLYSFYRSDELVAVLAFALGMVTTTVRLVST